MEAQNALEATLAKAAEDPASRPAFYRMLLDSKVFVIGNSDLPASEGGVVDSVTVPSGAMLSIVNWQKADGTPVVPFFASLASLQRALDEEARYMELPAKSLFELTLGEWLVMNPASPCWKEFSPTEIKALLETGMNHTANSRTVEKETQVLLGQPRHYPAEMVSALTKLLEMHPVIVAAYLCLMHDQSANEQPSLVVGFVSDGDPTEALREAGSVAADTAPRGQAVEFVLIKPEEQGISQYMLDEVRPFYQR